MPASTGAGSGSGSGTPRRGRRTAGSSARPTSRTTRRRPLSRERVLRAAVRLADEGGLDAVSMRRLGQALHVEAMSLYKHVTGKEDILDGMADLVTGEFAVPSYDVGWRESIRLSATSAHEVLLRHPWAGALIESRSGAGPARLRYLDAVIGVLTTAGFPMPTVVRAIMTLDSYVYGFTLQELAWPYDAGTAPASAEALAQALPAGEFANLRAMAGMVTSEPWTVVVDFPFGLDLILDGLERLRDARVRDRVSSAPVDSAVRPSGSRPGRA